MCQSDVRFSLLHLVNIVLLVPVNSVGCRFSSFLSLWPFFLSCKYQTISFGFDEVNFLLLFLAVQFIQLNVTIICCILKWWKIIWITMTIDISWDVHLMFVGEKHNETIANYMVMYVILINGEWFFLSVLNRGISLCPFVHSHIKKNALLKWDSILWSLFFLEICINA